jgi:hypothetical protein
MKFLLLVIINAYYITCPNETPSLNVNYGSKKQWLMSKRDKAAIKQRLESQVIIIF